VNTRRCQCWVNIRFCRRGTRSSRRASGRRSGRQDGWRRGREGDWRIRVQITWSREWKWNGYRTVGGRVWWGGFWAGVFMRKRKNLFMKDHIPRDKNAIHFWMKTFIAFMMGAIAQEYTWFRPKREFVRIVRSKIRETSAAKNLEVMIIKSLREKFFKGRNVFEWGSWQPIN
jgi:hypothetical protein